MPVPILREVAQVLDQSPLDLWGGRDGELPALYLSTGGRQGGASTIYALQKGAPDTAWIEESIPGGAETIGKIRDDGTRVYAFFETGGPNFLISRDIVGGSWEGEPLPGDDFVGGRGLYCAPDGTIHAGGAAEWNVGVRRGELYVGSHDSWGGPERERTPGILWECEADDDGLIWEFWHETSGNPEVAYRDGEEVAAPFPHVACASPFGGAMYATGNQPEDDPSPDVRRFNGADWETVFSFPGDSNGDHILRIPRDPPELWAIAQRTFRVAWSLDGDTWEEIVVPDIQTDTDTNQLTAVAFFNRRVFVATRDAGMGLIRIFADRVAADDVLVQVI